MALFDNAANQRAPGQQPRPQGKSQGKAPWGRGCLDSCSLTTARALLPGDHYM